MVTTGQAWYRTPYVWMLIFIPLSAVIMGFFLLYFAIESDDGLVKDDYYKHGKEINRVLGRDRLAAKLGLSGQMQFSIETGTVTLQLQASDPQTLPAAIQLAMLHATRAGYDQEISLNRTPTGAYFGVLPALQPGRWHAQLSADDWRLTGSLRMPTESRVSFSSSQYSIK